jgi:hypothetical protein
LGYDSSLSFGGTARRRAVTGETYSIFVGTLGLSVAGLVALSLSASRAGITADFVNSIRWMSGLTLGAQLLHFSEEYLHRFYVRFPELLGLTVWSDTFFVIFNLTWLVIWAVAIVGLRKLPRVAAIPLWFLAIASAVNGVAHPIMSVAVAGYFPGLWSSLIVGILGFILLHRLFLATSTRVGIHGGT